MRYSEQEMVGMAQTENAIMSRTEKRAEFRSVVNQYYSVHFSVSGIDTGHQFVLWDISPHGLCFLIEEDSEVLAKLSVGDIFRMKYYPLELLGDTKYIRTQIRHITKDPSGRFGKYRMVGLLILENA